MGEITSKTKPAALDHITVLDLSRILAGPWATQTLADLGAEVLKIESPNSGDDTRSWGPPFLKNADGTSGDAAYFTACNRNKRSITVDFSKPAGANLIRDLAKKADVVVENFKVGGLQKYGLAYEDIKKINPSIVYCSITGFGQTGPYATRTGYDFLIQGMAGIMSVTGQPDGTPGSEPLKTGVAICDLFTGMYATVSILAALAHRDKSGQGQHIDCSLFESQIAMLVNQSANWQVGGTIPTRMGNQHPNIAPYSVFPTSDGHIIIACGNDGQFARLCQSLELEHLAIDERFSANAARISHRMVLQNLVSERTAQWSAEDLLEHLESNNIPCGPINSIPDVLTDPHAKDRGVVIESKRDDGTVVPGIKYPANLSITPAQVHLAPPELGADTEDVLSKTLGLNPGEIEHLRETKVI